MRLAKLFSFLVILCSGITTLRAQDLFTADPVKFPVQLQDYLGQQFDKKEAKIIVQEFLPVWNTLPDNVKNDVYRTSNMLAAKKVKVFPEFLGYIASVKYMGANNLFQHVYPGWNETLRHTFDARDKKHLPEFLTFSYYFFTEKAIYHSNSLVWKYSGNSFFAFSYDKTPLVTFEGVDLICNAKNDSSVIHKTSGVLLPLRGSWEGRGGTVTWERAGLRPEETYAELKNYAITLRTSAFNADSVRFYTPYFDTPLLGRLQERSMARAETKAAIFPQFQSYSKRLFIKDIFPGIDYDGGFSMQGASLMGYGLPQEMAHIFFYRNGKKFMQASSVLFAIKPEAIDAERAQMVIYLEKDSISHPYLRFKYQKKEHKVIFTRSREGFSQSPFFNTYHNLEMYFESLQWKVGDPAIELGPMFGSTDKTARFESSNYFSGKKYNEIQGMDRVHPMIPIEQFSIRKDTSELELSEVASFMGRTTEQIMGVIGILNSGGFLSYDPDLRTISVKKKLSDYIKAYNKKIDYDPIEIDSEVEGQSNALLNLETNELLIRGVKRVVLSDSQFVRIYPDRQELIVRKNRDMKFSGIINAGNTEFFGKDFFFSYADYRIDLKQCDSMRLRVPPFDRKEGGQQRVRSVIRGVEGHIAIDGNDNKSGLKKGYSEYPVLTSSKHTYVYYNDKSIYRGVYDSTAFYFKVDPFVMDSLDNFKPLAQRFPGELTSAGIFPTFREELGVQMDYSFGFVRKAPEGGMPLYGDKAVFKNEIRLSNKGLQADGSVNFLTATAQSDEFTLFPDSLTGIAQQYVNIEQKASLETPSVKGSNVLVRYMPKQKVMYAQSRDSLLHFFDDNARMRGTTALRPDGMTGRGRMYFGTAELSSRVFKYKSKNINADTSAFRLKNTDGGSDLAFKTDNVNANIDFVKRLGDFKSNGDETFVEFPENQYICYMDRFKWFMDQEEIELESGRKTASGNITIDTDVDLARSNFYSVHPEQDSLRFMAPKARYDIRKKIITCNEVDFINVADARIYPDSQRVIIQRKARIETLKNARIVANYITKYHSIYNATVDIAARRRYTAAGDYSYLDENKMEQKVHFANITLDSTFQTYARGEISEEERFMLSPNFEYKGAVELKAIDKGLNFDGATRIVHKCADIDRRWFGFKAVIDPADIRIPVGPDLVNYEGGFLGSGISLNPDSVAVYPSFLSLKGKKEHPDVLKSDGFLVFDKRTQEYQIAREDKLKEHTLPGNFVAFAKEKCEIRGEGQLAFGTNFGQFKVIPIGTVTQNTATGEMSMKVAIVLDFPFSENAMEKMADKLINYPDLMPFDYTKSNYEKALRELVGLEKSDKMIADLGLYGEVKRFPSELDKPLVIADVSLKWVPGEDIFISTSKIGIANVYKKQLFKYVDGRIKIQKRRTGDIFSIVLQLDDNTWYYFTYKNEVMDACASDDNFNKQLQETKDDKRKFKGSKGEQDFEYRFGNKRNEARNLMLGE